MPQGTIKRLVTERGFGFVKQSTGGPDLFFHVTGMAPDCNFDDLRAEQRVSFETEQSDRGPRAIRVRPLP
jgi:CspA family cold shock protein